MCKSACARECCARRAHEMRCLLTAGREAGTEEDQARAGRLKPAAWAAAAVDTGQAAAQCLWPCRRRRRCGNRGNSAPPRRPAARGRRSCGGGSSGGGGGGGGSGGSGGGSRGGRGRENRRARLVDYQRCRRARLEERRQLVPAQQHWSKDGTVAMAANASLRWLAESGQLAR